ncbi:MAG TPA: T9SS type A sorting domain-containing protein, partial [candidate division WOR-3 bacterium]|nr:T9SS type A sorting domain-containing protein [candidate division WOR-3 bacterium]
RNLTWMYETTPYVGVAILDPPRSTPAANLALIDHALYVYPNSGLQDSIQLKFTAGTIQNPSSNRAYDWSTCNSAGPFTLAPGGSAVAAFAIVGGDNLADLQANADTAYNRYWNWPGVQEKPSGAVINGIKIYPVISHGQPFTLQYGFTQKTNVQVKIYDAIGRLVDQKDFGQLNGSGELRLNFNSQSQGVYFIKLKAGNTTKTAKIIWLR